MTSGMCTRHARDEPTRNSHSRTESLTTSSPELHALLAPIYVRQPHSYRTMPISPQHRCSFPRTWSVRSGNNTLPHTQNLKGNHTPPLWRKQRLTTFINKSLQHRVQSSRLWGESLPYAALRPRRVKHHWLLLKKDNPYTDHRNIQERLSALLAMPSTNTDDKMLPQNRTCRQRSMAIQHAAAEDRWDNDRRLVGCDTMTQAEREVCLLETSGSSRHLKLKRSCALWQAHCIKTLLSCCSLPAARAMLDLRLLKLSGPITRV